MNETHHTSRATPLARAYLAYDTNLFLQIVI